MIPKEWNQHNMGFILWEPLKFDMHDDVHNIIYKGM